MRLLPVGKRYFAQVDDSDYEYLNQFKWYLEEHYRKDRTKYCYATTSIYNGKGGKQNKTKMHRLILPGVKMIDHIDGDGLNNQRSNLRPCTHSDNAKNSRPRGTSKYKGVSWHFHSNKWIAHIKIGKKYKHLGIYDDEIAAAKAYDMAALSTNDPFYRINGI